MFAGAVGPGAVGAGEVGFGVAGVGVDGFVVVGVAGVPEFAVAAGLTTTGAAGEFGTPTPGVTKPGTGTSGCEALGMTPPSVVGTLPAPLPVEFDDRSLFGVDASRVPLFGEEPLGDVLF